MSAIARLRLKLLGGFEARLAEGPVIEIAAKKTRALLAYLALAGGRRCGRDKLADLLWSDRDDKQARDSLGQALVDLRDALADIRPSPLTADHDHVSIDPAAVEVDALQFERLAGRDNADELRHAVALYDGDLLDGVGVRDPAFEDWLRDEQQRYRELMVAVLKRLLAHETGASALAVAKRLLALDPLQEEGYRALMRLHNEGGDIAAALRQYDTCCATLKRELDIAPSPETEALHQQIRDQSAARPGRDHPAPSPADVSQPQTATTSKPSIAVLPFTNMSGDPEQQYFSDGITEDIITELSRYRELLVIARNSSFQYRDKSVDVRRVGRELGVEYLVEGSLRKVGDRLRITAQLVEVYTGSHVWANRYDRSLEDVFALQDEVTQTIAATLVGQLGRSGAERARRKPTDNWAAYDFLLQATQCIDQYDTIRAESLLKQALKIDPDYAHAYAMLSYAYATRFFEDVRWETITEALSCAQKALALDGTDYLCHAMVGFALTYFEQFDVAEIHLDKAVELNPNSCWAAGLRANLLARVGRTREALDAVDLNAKRNPLVPESYWELRSIILFQEKRYEEVVRSTSHKNSLQYWDHAYLAAAYVRLGREQEARAEAAEVLRMKPDFSISAYAKQDPFKNPADLKHLLDAFRAAGLPE